MDLETKIRVVIGKLEMSFEGSTFVHASALFRELVQEFGACVFGLSRLSEDQYGNSEAIAAISRRLCEVSREIIFSVDGDRIDANVKVSLTELYRLAVEIIESLEFVEDEHAKPISRYCTNIRKRAFPSSDKKIMDPWASIEHVTLQD